jgi:putative ABC transport system permease protein
MLRVTLRNLLARKVRLVLSAFAIVLGVSFLAGSLIFTDTIGKSFSNIVSGSVSDATVRMAGSDGSGFSSSYNIDARTIPAAFVDEVADVKGVAKADGSVDGTTLFVLKKDGKLLGGTGAPTLTYNYGEMLNVNGEPAVTISQGRAPEASGEVALDSRSVDLAGYKVGDTVKMITAGDEPELSAKLVGVADFAGGGLAGASLVFFDTKTAQDIFLGGKDEFTSITIQAADGYTQQQVADAIGEILPEGTEVLTGDELADEVKGVIDTVLGFLNTFLLVFAAIALVVGSFLIVNTFSILVAQRSRELALLRALGASRRQVTRSVLAEALAIGVLGSTLGLALGYALAVGLRAIFAEFGLDLSGNPLVFAPRTVLVSYIVGIAVTMVAAYLPARRASKVAPVQAMRDDVALPEATIKRRVLAGAVIAVLGAVLIAYGLTGSGGSAGIALGLGVFAVLMAVTMASPVISHPVLVVFGAVYERLFGTVGKLATNNALRNPRRTAATASALMIGLALVTTMSVLGASINKSIDAEVQKDFTSDYLISNAIGQPFSPTIAADIAKLDGVEAVAPTQTFFAEIDGKGSYLSATDSGELGKIFSIDYAQGAPAVSDGEIALSQDKADALKVTVGDDVELKFAAGSVTSTVTGIYKSTYVVNDAITPFSTVEAGRLQRADSSVAVNAVAGTDLPEFGKRLEKATDGYPTVTVQNKDDFSKAQRSQVDQLLLLIYALLGLAIVIAVLGIVNTLALSVIERTREVGLLRAVGLSRRQLRRMVRLEAIAIAVLGALLGIVTGLLFGVVLRQAVADDGISELAIPWVRLGVFVVIAAVVGVLAAVMPARRAAKLDVLKAITSS